LLDEVSIVLGRLAAALTKWIGVVGHEAFDGCISDGPVTIAILLLRLRLGLGLVLHGVLDRASAVAILLLRLRLGLLLHGILDRALAAAVLLLRLGLGLLLHGILDRALTAAVLLLRLRLGLLLLLLLHGILDRALAAAVLLLRLRLGLGLHRVLATLNTLLNLDTLLCLNGFANRAAPESSQQVPSFQRFYPQHLASHLSILSEEILENRTKSRTLGRFAGEADGSGRDGNLPQ